MAEEKEKEKNVDPNSKSNFKSEGRKTNLLLQQFSPQLKVVNFQMSECYSTEKPMEREYLASNGAKNLSYDGISVLSKCRDC